MTDGTARSKWPLGLLGMLAIVFATERYVASRDYDLGTMYSLEWHRSGRAVKKEGAKADILCLGTSVTRLGVCPTVLEETTGMTAFNAAISGGQPFASYTMLRHALDAGAKPKAIVVDFKWSAIAVDYTWNERVLPEMATLRDCAELALAARDASYLGRLALVSKLPTYRCRAEIRTNIAAAIDGREPARNEGQWTMYRNAAVNRGGILIPVGAVNQGFNPDDIYLFPTDWRCHPLSAAYIDRFFDLAASRKIPVFWLVTPIGPEVLAHREAIGAEARYTQFLRETSARHPGVTVVDARRSRYAPETFFDTTHLNRDGAVTLSADLAETIRRTLKSPPSATDLRWVQLPDYRPNPRAHQYEDQGESLAIVQKQWTEKARR